MAVSCRIAVIVTPRAASDAIAGWREDAVVVRVQAPPIEGRANAAVVELLARRLGLPARDLAVVVGAGGRRKLIEIRGLDFESVRRLLGG